MVDRCNSCTASSDHQLSSQNERVRVVTALDCSQALLAPSPPQQQSSGISNSSLVQLLRSRDRTNDFDCLLDWKSSPPNGDSVGGLA